jgi:hypothetical protein
MPFPEDFKSVDGDTGKAPPLTPPEPDLLFFGNANVEGEIGPQSHSRSLD